MRNIFDIHISTVLELHSTMNEDTISTNTSRKSSIGTLSIVSIANDKEENTCRKESIQSFSNISLSNNIGEDKLQGTYAKCHFFYPFSYLLWWAFLQFSAHWWFFCWVYPNKIRNKDSKVFGKKLSHLNLLVKLMCTWNAVILNHNLSEKCFLYLFHSVDNYIL